MTGRLARLLACAGVIAGVACIDITVDSNDLGSLRFVPLPFPSVDEGDTLRDANDVKTPLRAIAYRANGDSDATIPVIFVALDSGIKVDSVAHILVGNPFPATKTLDTVRLIASAAGLQTTAQRLFIVPKADTFATDETKLVDSIRYTLPSSSSDVSDPFTVKIGKKGGTQAQPTILASPGYLVRYTLKKGNTTIPANDTLGAFSFTESGRISSVDTTDASGTASRVLQYRIRPGRPTTDTVTVLAEAKRGSRLTNTIQWTVIVLPK